ncbi:amylo-alpha-1,6-glucosidase [Tengunoibacter tsumagoiensis]|uniref:Glycogen debranching protein n=1 Tax=Tengunoibacter tsumagoiensis TaxID=2014871 RepID=A0A402A260_9CHLR|nr:amylo-alpha-1,6-glucosidase [Tengunoibacter tsumagoiensis]GCE13237.1 glycogen debranching protein [Tengunoibacter tsumagoiensis]
MLLEKNTTLRQPQFANAWHLQLGPEVCQNVQASLDLEWLVTNGLGGYAAGSLVGATTSSYHGLLVASLHPPVERTVLVTKVDETVALPDGQMLQLGVNEYQGGILDPHGASLLEMVSLEGDIPCFVYRLNETLSLEKRIWMEYGQNTTYVQYTLRGAFQDDDSAHPERIDHTIKLTLAPFCLTRDYHSTTIGSNDWHFLVESQPNRCMVRAFVEAVPFQLIADPTATFTPGGLWYWHIWHRRDAERGLPASEDVYQPGHFQLTLQPGIRKTLVLSSEPHLSNDFGTQQHETAIAQALMRHQRRVRQILAVADRSIDNLQVADPVHARLVLAADQFIVARPDYSAAKTPLRLSPDRKTVIAGYPWFTDWGRDSMISLPGLFLYTGRYSEARGLLKAFVSFMQNGLIPNRFADSGEERAYNTVDATLWLFRALDLYVAKTADWQLLKELFPALQSCIQHHIDGTDYGIGLDSGDGLLHAGAPGVQLTWMDARVDDWVVTPRRGKPVEINALWYYALCAMEYWAVHLSIDATLYSRLRHQVRQNFASRFWYEEGGYLYDVVDVDGEPGRNDASLRPNQLFAASLTTDLLSDSQTTRLFQQVTEHLLTPLGLRTLSPTDPAYQNHFHGDRHQRDGAYHQGTVWPWLLGPYLDVHLRLYNDRTALIPLLRPLVEALWENCLGTLGEVVEPEAPFTMGGCFAQAWSVAEILRCWLLAVG